MWQRGNAFQKVIFSYLPNVILCPLPNKMFSSFVCAKCKVQHVSECNALSCAKCKVQHVSNWNIQSFTKCNVWLLQNVMFSLLPNVMFSTFLQTHSVYCQMYCSVGFPNVMYSCLPNVMVSMFPNVMFNILPNVMFGVFPNVRLSFFVQKLPLCLFRFIPGQLGLSAPRLTLPRPTHFTFFLL